MFLIFLVHSALAADVVQYDAANVKIDSKARTATVTSRDAGCTAPASAMGPSAVLFGTDVLIGEVIAVDSKACSLTMKLDTLKQLAAIRSAEQDVYGAFASGAKEPGALGIWVTDGAAIWGTDGIRTPVPAWLLVAELPTLGTAISNKDLAKLGFDLDALVDDGAADILGTARVIELEASTPKDWCRVHSCR